MNGMITKPLSTVRAPKSAAGVTTTLAALGLALLGAAPSLPAEPAGAPPTALVEQLRGWHYGQGREPLDALEKLVAQAILNPNQRPALAASLAGLLKSEAAFDIKQFACRQLVFIGTEKEVGALADSLRQTDEPLASMALYALGRIQGSEADAALRAAARSTSGNTQLGVIQVLGQRRDPGAVPVLASLATAGGKQAVAAAVALGQIGGKQAAAALQAALPKADSALRNVLPEAMLACAQRCRLAGDPKLALSLIDSVEKEFPLPRWQAAALREYVDVKGGKALPRLVAALREDGTPRQGMAATLVRELPGRDIGDKLARHLSSLSPTGQRLLVQALADRGAGTAARTVVELVGSRDEAVRLTALDALGTLGNPTTVPLLTLKAAGGSAEERKVARASLTRLRGRGIEQALLEHLNLTGPQQAVELMEVLGRRGVTNAVPALMARLDHPDPRLRLTAWRVLQELGQPAHQPALIQHLLAVKESERGEAENTVAAVGRLASGAAQSAPVLTVLPQVSEAPVRSSLLRVLGQLGGPEALAALRLSLRDADSTVALTATRILADWPSDEPLDDLLALARRTQDARLRSVALRGYVRQIGANEGRSAAQALAMYRDGLTLATGVDDKRLVLSGLAQLRSPAVLDLAAESLKDPALRKEAEVAVLQIAQAIAGAYRERTKPVLQDLAKNGSQEFSRKQAAGILAFIEKRDDFVTAWEVSPAYTKDNATAQSLFDAPFPPELPAEAGKVAWRLMPTGTDPAKPWLVDLLTFLGGETRVAYLRTKVWSERAQSLVLELGSDDGAKVWLNDEIVHANNAMRAVEPSQDKVTVSLKQGWNPIMIKVTQNNQGWGLAARFRKADGSAAPGLRVEP
jgi:HEAT repeat protein